MFGNDDESEGDGVEAKVEGVVAGVEGGEKEEEDGDDGEEHAGGRVLQPVIDLLPTSQIPGSALIARQPRRRLDPVQEPEGDGVVGQVGHRPDPGDGEKGQRNAEHHDVKEDDEKDVKQPEPATVHVVGVGVLVAVTAGQVHHLAAVFSRNFFPRIKMVGVCIRRSECPW